jgi:hypothetical protein
MVEVGKEGSVPYDAPCEAICRRRMMGFGGGPVRSRHYCDNGEETWASKPGSGSGLTKREEES